MGDRRVADILIVEDDPGFQKKLQEYVGIHKCSTFCVGNLADTKTALAEWSYDLVLLDVQLPDGLSTEIVTQIPHTPVLYISEIADSTLIRSLISKSPNVIGYLAKPIALDRFSLTLTAALNAARQFTANVQAQKALATEIDQMRDKIHADLHDGLAQYLVGMNLLAGTLSRGLDDEQLDIGMLRRTINLLQESIRSAKLAVREVARPFDGQDEGSGKLEDWIDTLVQSWSVIQNRVSIFIDIDPHCADLLSHDHARVVFKVVREALINAIHHSEAATITIGLRINDIPPVLHGMVADDGKGISQGNEGECEWGGGLVWMRTRIGRLNGIFEVKSAESGGTLVEFRVPLETSTGYSKRHVMEEQGTRQYRALFFEQADRLLSEICEVDDLETRGRILSSLVGLARLAGFEEIAKVAEKLGNAFEPSQHSEILESLQSEVAACLDEASGRRYPSPH